MKMSTILKQIREQNPRVCGVANGELWIGEGTLLSETSLDYEHSLVNSLSIFSRVGCQVFYMWKKSEQFDCLLFNYFIFILFLLTYNANITKGRKAARN